MESGVRTLNTIHLNLYFSSEGKKKIRRIQSKIYFLFLHKVHTIKLFWPIQDISLCMKVSLEAIADL